MKFFNLNKLFQYLYQLIFAVLIISYPVFSQNLEFIREPYLQRVSDSQVIIRYRTNLEVSSSVRYGRSAQNLNRQANGPVTSEHRIVISNLEPETKYYYQINSSNLVLTNNDGSYFFKTNPVPASNRNVRIWVLGDSGRGNDGAISVKEAYKNFANETKRPADLLLMLGDNAYNNGLDAEYTNKLFKIYPEILRNTPLWPTLGNHDGYASRYVSGEIPYYQSFSLPRNAEVGGIPSGTESYYSFNYANIHFICLNSYDENRNNNSEMAEWLKRDLASNDNKWTIAFWHHPPYSKGSHNSDTEVLMVEMREQILPILETAGVDLVLTGHSHSYERSMLINGHYGLSNTLSPAMILNNSQDFYRKPSNPTPNSGTIYLVNGAGGNVVDGSLDHPTMVISFAKLGSTILDINKNRLEAKMIAYDSKIEDSFVISKEPLVIIPSSQEVISGKVAGELSLLTSHDNLAQKIASREIGSRRRVNVTYRFDLPAGNPQKKIKFVARKRKASYQNFKILYSTDQVNFKRLAFIRNYRSIGSRRFILEDINSETLSLKFLSTRNRKLDNYSSLILDRLILEN